MENETGAESISEQLDAAIEEEVDTSESPTEETGNDRVEAKGTSPESKQAQAVPYTRFKEVNDARKEIQDQFEELEKEYREQAASLTELSKLVSAAKEDQDLLNEIKAFAKDPTMLPHIEAIDKKLKGIDLDDAVEELEGKDDKSLDKTRKLLESEQHKLAEQLEEQRFEALTQRADSVADQWLDALPQEYDTQDREVVSRLWANEMEDRWDDLVEDPSSLQEVLTETFQSAIDTFGIPRGGLVDPDDPDSYEIEMPPEPDPVEELMDTIKGKNYSAVKEGGTPEISDEEFAQDLAKAIKLGR